MNLNPYLTFDGTCREAFAFYERTLGGRVSIMMTTGESPIASDVPQSAHARILHASLDFGGGKVLMGSDSMPGQHKTPQGFVVSYSVGTADEARRVFDAMVDGGHVTMPIGPTFWSPQFGMLVDRFGIPWMIGCDTEGATSA